jgi:hypothetical protein
MLLACAGVAPGSVGLLGTPGEAEPLLLCCFFLNEGNLKKALLRVVGVVATGAGLSWLSDSVSVTSACW